MPANSEGRTAEPEIPDILPLLPIRDLVVFPYMIVPLRVTRPVSMEAVTKALEADERLCFLVAQKNSGEDDPGPNGFYRTGTIGMIMRMRKLSEGGFKVLVQGLCRARFSKVVSSSPFIYNYSSLSLPWSAIKIATQHRSHLSCCLL